MNTHDARDGHVPPPAIVRVKAFKSQAGFTLLELLVVIGLVIILFVTAIENLLPLRAAAERAAHAATVSGVRSAVGLEATRRVVQRGADGLEEMDRANPVAWLASPPSNYIGNVTAHDYRQIPRGGWGFDPASRVLFYRLRYPEYVEGGYAPPAGIRYRVEVRRTPGGGIREVGLIQLDEAQWRIEGSEVRRWLEQIIR